MSAHIRAVLLALLVTVLWSSSWVLITFGLRDLPALPFAGLRYGLAAVCLLPFALAHPGVRREVRTLRPADWGWLVALGLTLYSVTQGAQFVALSYLPAQTTSLLLSVSPVVVALAGIGLLGEVPGALQWTGTLMYVTGAVVFLYPADFPADEWLGVGVAVTGVLANSAAVLIGRAVNRRRALRPLTVTAVSMSIGAGALLGGGLATAPMPTVTGVHWAIIGWLALVNTAVAFTLWNHTQRTLSATESSVINSTMLIQIAVLAWLFLGEPLGIQEITGLSLAAGGVLLVQLRRASRRNGPPRQQPAFPLRPTLRRGPLSRPEV